MSSATPDCPSRYAYPVTAGLFALGGLVTALFSGSLAKMAVNVKFAEVLGTGMIVPTFTWAIQLAASGVYLGSRARRWYWGDLGRVCLLGSFALLPAAAVNLSMIAPPLWISATNVIASVLLMAWALFRLSAAHGISRRWPLSWCAVICCNMALFYGASHHWWGGTQAG